MGRVTKLELQIGDWGLPIYSVVVSSTGQYILGMDILWGDTLEINGTYRAFVTTQGLHARVITTTRSRNPQSHRNCKYEAL